METLYAFKFVMFWLVIGIIVVFAFFIRSEYKIYRRKRELQENEFMMLYLWLQDHVRCSAVTKDNYLITCEQFCKLNRLKYKDKEKTDVLFREFIERFKTVAL
jgi:hypothetical protein